MRDEETLGAVEPEGDEGITDPPAKDKPTNQLERLRERRRALQDPQAPLDLAIPGYGEELVGRYRVLTYDEMERLQRRGGKMAQAQDREAQLKVTMDTIAAACVGLFVRQEDGSLMPMNECPSDLDLGDEPIRYEERLAQILGIDSSGKVRVLIREMFPTELSIIGHLERIDAWMSGINEDGDEGF